MGKERWGDEGGCGRGGCGDNKSGSNVEQKD